MLSSSRNVLRLTPCRRPNPNVVGPVWMRSVLPFPTGGVCLQRGITTDDDDDNDDGDNERKLLSATRNWYQSIVTGPLNLCPFAPRNSSLVRIVRSDATTTEGIVEDVRDELHCLLGGDGCDENTNTKTNTTTKTTTTSCSDHHQTTLIVLDPSTSSSSSCSWIHDFRSFVRLSWTLQEDAVLANGYASKVQLVLFHPEATHNTYSHHPTADAGDYSIRSPYPTIHLLREEDVLQAAKSGYGLDKLGELPSRNKTKLREMGVDKCASMLANCKLEVEPK